MKLGYQESTNALEVRIDAHKRFAALKLEDTLESCLAGQSNARILDVGCGTGNFSDLFSKHASLYVGMDVNSDLLCRAQKKCEGLGLRQTLFIARSMDEPFPFVDGSFDLIFFVYSAYYTNDVSALLDRTYKALAPKGKVYFLGPIAGNGVELDAICESLFGVTSTKEKDTRVDRLGKEFAPALTHRFGKHELKQMDFSLSFPNVKDYLNYVRATPQYLELAKTGTPKTDSDIQKAINQTGGLKLTKKALVLWAEHP